MTKAMPLELIDPWLIVRVTVPGLASLSGVMLTLGWFGRAKVPAPLVPLRSPMAPGGKPLPFRRTERGCPAPRPPTLVLAGSTDVMTGDAGTRPASKLGGMKVVAVVVGFGFTS